MLSGLIEAFVAAAAYGFGTILQAVGVGRLTSVDVEAGWWRRLRAGWPYGAGLVLDLVGLLSSIAALRTLPLFLVESAVAASVGVTAAAAVVLLGVRLSQIETVALITMLMGLVMLASCAQPGPAQGVAAAARWGLLAGALTLAALVWVGLRSARTGCAVLLAIVSGLGFALVGVAARVLEPQTPWWHSIWDPTVWALATAGSAGTIAFGLALGRSPVTVVAAITFAVETSVPSVLGLWLLGDAVRPHMEVAAVAGFAATLGGCVSLARLADAEGTLPHQVTAS